MFVFVVGRGRYIQLKPVSQLVKYYFCNLNTERSHKRFKPGAIVWQPHVRVTKSIHNLCVSANIECVEFKHWNGYSWMTVVHIIKVPIQSALWDFKWRPTNLSYDINIVSYCWTARTYIMIFWRLCFSKTN